MIYKSFLEESADVAMFKDELSYSKAAGFVLGEHIAKTRPGARALIIVDSKDNGSAIIKAGLEGLLKGLGDSVAASVDSPDFAPNNEQASAENIKISPEKMIFLMKKSKAESFDNLISKYSDCNVIISLIGLPENPEAMALWQIEPENRPYIALLRSRVEKYRDAIMLGAINAAVTNKPGEPPRNKAKNNLEAFENRYLLITPENLPEIETKYPEMFEKTI